VPYIWLENLGILALISPFFGALVYAGLTRRGFASALAAVPLGLLFWQAFAVDAVTVTLVLWPEAVMLVLAGWMVAWHRRWTQIGFMAMMMLFYALVLFLVF